MSDERKILLVLGASSDVGVELIRRVAVNYDVILAHYCYNSDNLEELKNAIGEKMVLLQSDFSNKENVQKFIIEIEEKNFLPTHIVHFTASKCKNFKFPKLKINELENDIQTSLCSLITVLQEFLPKMAKKKKGKIIVMLTAYTKNIPPKYLSQYVTVKYALLGLVNSLAVEYADKGITVNGVSPEMMETKFLSEIPDLIIQQNAAASPLGRNLTVNDVMPTFEFLLSDAANCITGQNIAITGGK
jgi:3-oxoacyl-[acyl-carrier protein] reductase